MVQPVVENPLEPLFEGWQRGLAIVVHPNDLGFGAAVVIALDPAGLTDCVMPGYEWRGGHRRLGVGAGPAGSRGEQRAAAAVVGVAAVEFLG